MHVVRQNKMKRKRINIKAAYRALCSDTLPYELPVIFTNVGLEEFLYRYSVVCRDGFLSTRKSQANKWLIKILKILNDTGDKEIESYTYNILKGYSDSIVGENANHTSEKKKRKLTIPHPLRQIEICELYRRYSDLLLYHCSKSPCSIRYPYKVGRYMGRPRHGIPSTIDIDEKSTDSDSPKQFFAYKRYQNINGFYNDYVYQRAEKKYAYMMRTDIKHCFDCIKPKDLYKAVYGCKFSDIAEYGGFVADFVGLENNMFAGTLDNDNKTDVGIPIGPEFSRLFAEIIQQRIDLQLIDGIKEYCNARIGVDYNFYRYVDDGFFFCNDEDLLEKFPYIYNEVLDKWGLQINEKKMKYFGKRPFVDVLTIAKRQTNLIVEDFCKNWLDTLKGFENRMSGVFEVPFKMNANYVIRDLQSLVVEYKIKYEDITASLLTTIRKKLFEVYADFESLTKPYLKAIEYKEIDDKGKGILDSYENSFSVFCRELVSVLAYIFSCDPRMSTSIKIEQMLVEMIMFVEGRQKMDDIKIPPFEKSHKSIIYKRINDELRTILKNNKEKGVEIMNLMLVYHKLPKFYKPTARLIEKIFLDDEDELSECKNFMAVTTLEHIVGKYYRFGKVQKAIESWIEKRLEEKDANATERTMLTLIMLSCPYIDSNTKGRICNKIGFDDYESLVNESKHYQNIIVEWSCNKMLSLNYSKTSSQVY